MMIVKLTWGRVGVMFKHRMFAKPVFDDRTCERFMNGVTHCEVYRFSESNPIDAQLIATGTGICKWPDPFTRALGRKASLTSALRKRWGKKDGEGTPEHGFDRDSRVAIWDAYWRYTSPQSTVAPRDTTIEDPHIAATILDGTVVQADTIIDHELHPPA